jgi:SAM-dependent methyltransferase
VPADTISDVYSDIAAFYDELAPLEERQHENPYRNVLRGIYQTLIPRGHSVLEIGSARGDLLAAVAPSRGVGVDVSERMVEIARSRHPELEFVHGAGESFQSDKKFDYILLSDVAPFVYDLQALFEAVAANSHDRTRVVLNTFSNAWRPLLTAATRLGLRPDHPVRNWVAPHDLDNLLTLAGLEVVSRRQEILLPMRPGPLSTLANGVLTRLPLLRSMAASYWVVARPAPEPRDQASVSVVVPCRNESGSIDELVERIPDMGTATEIVFAEGGSTDGTRALIEAAIERRSDRDMKLVVQSGKGKANAMREAFAACKNDILMILDGDMTVVPEDLPKFYDGLVSGRGDLLNGVRLVYGMEPGAMRFFNLVGNRFFAWLMSFVLGQYAKDTLCGTKALFREDYDRIVARRHEFGYEDDPFGDFELLLGASLLGLTILNVPVRYRARVYGEPQIDRFPDGRRLFKLAASGFRCIWLDPVRGAQRPAAQAPAEAPPGSADAEPAGHVRG